MMKKLVIALFVLAVWHTAMSQVNVYHVNNFSGQAAGSGTFYVLPLTVLKVDVIVRSEEQLKGPYAEYASKFLGLEDVNNFDFSTYNIEKVVITTISEPDPDQQYFVEMGAGDSKNLRTFNLKLNNSGFLLSANDLNQYSSTEQKKSIELVEFENPAAGKSFPEFYVSGNVITKVDTIIRRVTVDTLNTEQFFYRTRLEDKTTEQMAVAALGKLQQIRDSQYNLLTGFQETPYESGTIKFMFDNLKKLENEYLDLFRGKSFTEYYHYTYYYTPDAGSVKNPLTLFQFSTGSGVSKSGSGEKVQLQLIPVGLEKSLSSFPDAPSNTGLAYRIPEIAVVKLKLEDEVLFENRITVNQLGQIKRLPARRFNAEFSPETGGLKTLFLETGER
ncbi:MAG: DUF4831 family protein [Bacteroidales bacterium]|nr:DUF4831 family protein [Bacteroidales bacterium]